MLISFFLLIIHEHKNTVAEIISDDKKFTRLANELFSAFLNNIREHWRAEALRCFGEEWQNIIKRNSAPTSIIISDDNNRIILDLLSSKKDTPPSFDLMLEDIKEEISPFLKMSDDIREFIEVHELTHLMSVTISASFNPLSNVPKYIKFRDIWMSRRRKPVEDTGTHYLPAVRGFLMQSHRALVSAVVARAPTIGLTGAEIVPFTGVLADFLEKLIMIDENNTMPNSRSGRKIKDIYKLSSEIEQKNHARYNHNENLANTLPGFSLPVYR